MNRILTFAAAAGTAALMSLSPLSMAHAQKTVTLKFSNVTSQSGKDAGIKFKEIAEKESNGTLKIELYPDNQLGDDRSVVEGTIFGDIDIVVSSTSPLATMFPDFYMFDAPFLFLGTEQAYKGLDGEIGQKVLDDMAANSLKGLGWWENGFRNLTNSKVAAKLPDDIKSMKIRTMENEVHLAAWKAFGANPTPMAFTEVFTALQQGTIDGEENPLGIIDGNKFQEVQKYLSLTQHVYTPYILCMNDAKFKSLTEQQKAAILKASAETVTYQRARSQELEGEILKKVAKEGMEVIELSAEDKEKWREKVSEAKIYDLVKSKMKNPSYLDDMLK